MKNAIVIYAAFVFSSVCGAGLMYFLSPKIYEDSLTGCQYIKTMFTMTPRFDSDGEMVCNEAQK